MTSDELKTNLNSLMERGRSTERFFPFWVVINEKINEPLYDWCMYIVNLYIDHKDGDKNERIKELVKILKGYSKCVEPEGEYPFKTPIHEFLKVSADLIPDKYQ